MSVILFDMDGVIIDSEIVYMERLKKFLRYKGLNLSIEQLNLLIGSNTRKDRALYKEWFGDNFNYDKFINDQNEYFNKTPINYKQIIMKHAFEVIVALKNRDHSLSLVSSSSPNYIEEVVSSLNIKQYFDYLISGDSFLESKPNPAIYNYAKSKYECNKNIYVVEDSTYGIEAAKRASLPVIALKDRHFGMDQSRADYIIEDLIEILDIVD